MRDYVLRWETRGIPKFNDYGEWEREFEAENDEQAGEAAKVLIRMAPLPRMEGQSYQIHNPCLRPKPPEPIPFEVPKTVTY